METEPKNIANMNHEMSSNYRISDKSGGKKQPQFYI